jgi:hypothetical protein
MNPDFTLIGPLSCLKDGDHLYDRGEFSTWHLLCDPWTRDQELERAEVTRLAGAVSRLSRLGRHTLHL